MKITGSSIQQLERDKPKSKCRKWRLWATTESGRKSKRVNGTYTDAQNSVGVTLPRYAATRKAAFCAHSYCSVGGAAMLRIWACATQ